jgi:hypothetical protein
MNAAQRRIVSRSLFAFAGTFGVLFLVLTGLCVYSWISSELNFDPLAVLIVIGAPLLLLTSLTLVAGLYVRAGERDSTTRRGEEQEAAPAGRWRRRVLVALPLLIVSGLAADDLVTRLAKRGEEKTAPTLTEEKTAPTLTTGPAPAAPNLAAIVADPQFRALSTGAKRRVIAHFDPGFGALNEGEQDEVLRHLMGTTAAHEADTITTSREVTGDDLLRRAGLAPSTAPGPASPSLQQREQLARQEQAALEHCPGALCDKVPFEKDPEWCTLFRYACSPAEPAKEAAPH